MEAQALLDFSTLTCFIYKKMVWQYKLALVGKNTLVLIKVINNQNFSWGLVTHEIKALDVTITFHTNKVVFNDISSPKNLVFWLALHNSQVDWCMRSLHFETPQHEALECETLINM
jgi:hypothetical protein